VWARRKWCACGCGRRTVQFRLERGAIGVDLGLRARARPRRKIAAAGGATCGPRRVEAPEGLPEEPGARHHDQQKRHQQSSASPPSPARHGPHLFSQRGVRTRCHTITAPRCTHTNSSSSWIQANFFVPRTKIHEQNWLVSEGGLWRASLGKHVAAAACRLLAGGAPALGAGAAARRRGSRLQRLAADAVGCAAGDDGGRRAGADCAALLQGRRAESRARRPVLPR
jgi:hypothetical protein